MPTYQYACTACAERLEAVQKFSDDPLTECPACGGALRKVFSPVGVVFKGSGFYKTDSRSSAKPAASGAESKPTGADSGSGSSDSGSSSSAGSSSSDSSSGSSAGSASSSSGSSSSSSSTGPAAAAS